MAADKHTALVKSLSARLGFDYCGIARAVPLDDDARRLEEWLGKGMHGSMQYMANHFDLRVNPQRLVPGARSVITLLKNYFPKEQPQQDAVKIAKYAWGKDYHEVIRASLRQFLEGLKAVAGDIAGFCGQCSRAGKKLGAAQRAGLGGKEWQPH